MPLPPHLPPIVSLDAEGRVAKEGADDVLTSFVLGKYLGKVIWYGLFLSRNELAFIFDFCVHIICDF